ncbi:MAG: hypothetical protein Q9202_003037 [Teloschistes flavicans]
MAEVLPKSTVDPGSVGVKESLMHTLDDLLERYLNLVHQYYAQQQTLAKDLSSPTLRSTDMRNAKIRNPDTEKEMEAPVKDPLRWFGILVPSTLRASQSSFKSVVTEIVPYLVNISNEMKGLEVEIRRTRKKIRKLG